MNIAKGLIIQSLGTPAFLLRDDMRKRGLCCRTVSVCPSVCHVGAFYQYGRLSYRQTSLSDRYPALYFLAPSADTQFRGNPFSEGIKYKGWGNFAIFD